MMSMSIRVSYGWMLGSSKNKADDTLSRQIQLFVGLCVLLEVHKVINTSLSSSLFVLEGELGP